MIGMASLPGHQSVLRHSHRHAAGARQRAVWIARAVQPQLQNSTSSSAHEPGQLEPTSAAPTTPSSPTGPKTAQQAGYASGSGNGNGQLAEQPRPALECVQALPEQQQQQQAEQLSTQQQQQHVDAVQQAGSNGSNSIPQAAKKADTGWYYAVGLSAIAALICSVDRAAISVAILPMSEEYGWSDSTKGAINRWVGLRTICCSEAFC